MRYVLIFLLILFSSCLDFPDKPKEIKNYSDIYDKTCLEGVLYWDFMHKLAPAFNKDGTLQLCDEEEDDEEIKEIAILNH